MSKTVPLYGFGGGSGGSAINFKVVGGAVEPAVPEENMIWICTDQTITAYSFASVQPETAGEGEVWVFTGTDSSVAFSATKKNSVMVYPISAKQYVSGAWVDKTAKSHQGGEWVEWFTGFLGKGINKLGEPSFIDYANGGGSLTNTQFEKNQDGTFTIGASSANQWRNAGYVFPNKVDLSNYSTLSITYELLSMTGSFNSQLQLIESLSYTDSDYSNNIGTTSITTQNGAESLNTKYTKIIDVSGIDEAYLRFFVNFSSNNAHVIKIHEIIPS